MTSLRRSTLLCLSLIFAGFPCVHAEENFESLVQKLAADQYVVRAEAKKNLIELCRKDPELIERLAPIIFDEQDEIERSLNAREIAAASFVLVERGAIGFQLCSKMFVRNTVDKGPAKKSGIEVGYQLLSVDGKPVKGKDPAEIYSMVHATHPGSKLEMEFLKKDGDKVMLYPVAAPRSTIRSGENIEERRLELYEKWLEEKRKELADQSD